MCNYRNFFYSVCWSSAVSLHLKCLASIIRSSIQLYIVRVGRKLHAPLLYRVHLSESLATINCFTCSMKSRKQCNTGRKLRKETSKKFVCFIKITLQSGLLLLFRRVRKTFHQLLNIKHPFQTDIIRYNTPVRECASNIRDRDISSHPEG